MKLTKREISENVNSIKKPGFGNGFHYDVTVRGFQFETLRDQAGELVECDETGHLTFVSNVSNKKDVVNAIFNWFKEYAPQHFDD